MPMGHAPEGLGTQRGSLPALAHHPAHRRLQRHWRPAGPARPAPGGRLAQPTAPAPLLPEPAAELEKRVDENVAGHRDQTPSIEC